MSFVRTFIAIPIPDPQRMKINKFQDYLKKKNGDVKWISSDNMHLTLKFLGDVHESDLSAINDKVSSAVETETSFEVELKGTGVFPNEHNPRILWIGVNDKNHRLKRLVMQVNEELSILGIEKEKRSYTPHLTLGRVKSTKGLHDTLHEMNQLNADFGNLVIHTVCVFKSELETHGAEHTVLHRIKMQG